jgi:hypothetical protein
MCIDPGTLGELLEQGAVEAAYCAVVDVFDGGLMAQPGIAQAGMQPPVASVAGLLRENESQSLLANLVALRHRLFASLDVAEEAGDSAMVARVATAREPADRRPPAGRPWRRQHHPEHFDSAGLCRAAGGPRRRTTALP